MSLIQTYQKPQGVEESEETNASASPSAIDIAIYVDLAVTYDMQTALITAVSHIT
jgi:hypothetical protein